MYLSTLLLDAAPIATVTVEKDHANAASAARLIGEIPNLTWVNSPGVGAHIYRIDITVTGTALVSATANTRALNAIIFG